jgi:hypothetical protein
MVSGVSQLMGFWVPNEALSISPGLVDSDPDGLIMEKTNNMNYKLAAA